MVRKVQTMQDAFDTEIEGGGLFLRGNIVGRFRRVVSPSNGEPLEVVTYRVLAGTNVHEVDLWGPHAYFPVGASINWRVITTAFTSARGATRVRLRPENVEDGFDADAGG